MTTSLGLCEGVYCSGLFRENEDLAFDSLGGMESWFNSRLFAHNPKLTLQGCELVLCHSDIAPRNLFVAGRRVSLPPLLGLCRLLSELFESCAQYIEGKDGAFNPLLLNSMNRLPDHEMAQKEPFLWAWRNIQKYSL